MTTGSIRSRVHFPTGLLFTAPQVFASPLRALDRPSARCPARPPNNGQIPIRPATTLHQDRHKATITAMEYRQATVKDAAHELGVSTRTVERRIQSGDLPSEAVNGRRYVLLPTATTEPPPTDDTDTDGFPAWLDPRTVAWFRADLRHTWQEATAGLTDELRAQIPDPFDMDPDDPILPSGNTNPTATSPQEDRLRAVDADRDHWRHEAEQLHQRLAEVTATLYRLTEQKALPPPDKRTDSPRRWWQLWKSSRATKET